MANPTELAKEAFMNNILLVKALAVLKPPEERNRVTQWVEVLSKESANVEEQATKNEYLWYLLLILQHGHADCPPFNIVPYSAVLRPLSTILSESEYKEVARGAKNEIYFHDTVKELQKKRVASRTNWRTEDEDYDPYEVRTDPPVHDCKDPAERAAENMETTNPADFFANQLRPNEGAICYAAVFGDYSLDE